MYPNQADFITAVLARLAISKTALGGMLGYGNAYQAANQLSKGKKRLSYAETMQLLELCGWLIGELDQEPIDQEGLVGVAVARLLTGQEAIRDELQSLRKQVDGIRLLPQAPAAAGE